jgi:hypothetical protein
VEDKRSYDSKCPQLRKRKWHLLTSFMGIVGYYFLLLSFFILLQSIKIKNKKELIANKRMKIRYT